MTTPVCLWSGPRNVSTALMYSFAQRRDIRVVDEPLYGHYLRSTGAAHPGRAEIIANMNCDGDAVMQALLREQARRPSVRLFCKHMAHHLVEIDLDFLNRTSNVFLIRDPREMLPSLTIQLPEARLADTSLKQQWQLFSELSDAGQTPMILDSRELLLDPEGVLMQLCRHLRLDFDPVMLRWEPGPIAADGIWAPHWYEAVHRSTGFAPYSKKDYFPAELEALYEDCKPWYDKMFEHALKSRASGE